MSKYVVSKERMKEIIDYYFQNGDEKTIEIFGLKPETLERYKRFYKNMYSKEDFRFNDTLKQISERYTQNELQNLAKGSMIHSIKQDKVNINFNGNCITLGYLTDTHIGSTYFHEDYFENMLREFDKEKIDFICHSGDVTEGMSNRPGHIYELTHLGYERQREYAVNLFKKCNFPTYFINGNHDRWYYKENGANIVKDISDATNNIFLGFDEGDIFINGIDIKLWHGEDSSSYAISYRLQKLVEAFSGGEKPNVLLAGHTHKAGYFFIRNIHCFTGGALCRQSKWMRGKRLENHTGFYIIKLYIGEKGIVKVNSTFYPFYC